MTARSLILPLTVICLALLVTQTVAAHPSQRKILDAVAFEQRIGASLPGDARFMGADGEPVRLGELTSRPLVLMLAWFNCPNLCPMLLDRVALATAGLPFDTGDYRVAIVSIAPGEGPTDARRVRARLRRMHGDTIDNWRLLTGEKPTIDALAKVVGFQYAYDAERDRYAHPTGLVIVSPGGRINRYLFGLRPNAPDLKLALLAAGQSKLGSPVDQVLLRCYRFNPETGQYSLAVMNVLRVACGGSVLALGALVFWLRRQERQ